MLENTNRKGDPCELDINDNISKISNSRDIQEGFEAIIEAIDQILLQIGAAYTNQISGKPRSDTGDYFRKLTRLHSKLKAIRSEFLDIQGFGCCDIEQSVEEQKITSEVIGPWENTDWENLLKFNKELQSLLKKVLYVTREFTKKLKKQIKRNFFKNHNSLLANQTSVDELKLFLDKSSYIYRISCLLYKNINLWRASKKD